MDNKTTYQTISVSVSVYNDDIGEYATEVDASVLDETGSILIEASTSTPLTVDEKELMREAEKEAVGLPAKRKRGGKNVHGLTEMEESFCAHYAKTRNGKESMREAGYSLGAGNFWSYRLKKMLARPAIQKRLEEINTLAAMDVHVTRDIFHQKILAIYERAMAEGEYRAANAAMELLGKSLSFFTETKQNLNINANLSQVDPEKRLAGLKSLMNAIGLDK